MRTINRARITHYRTRRAIRRCLWHCLIPLMTGSALPNAMAQQEVATQPAPPGVTIEAEDFKPQSTPAGKGWKVVRNGEGNYMVDIIGYNHISGERLLSAPPDAANATAVATLTIPATGTYRVWSRFEQPTGTENRFRVEVMQNDKIVGSAVMGARDAPKHFFGGKIPLEQVDLAWGSEGLVEQSFDVAGLRPGPARIVLTALSQSEPAADCNVDFLFLTQDLQDSWRTRYAENSLYPILDAVLSAMPPRYYLRLSSPLAQTVGVTYNLNRVPWSAAEPAVQLEAGAPSAWIPLRRQDVSHFTTLNLSQAQVGTKVRAELATAPDERSILRTIEWTDPLFNSLLISLPPYPDKWPGEEIMTVEEQYQAVVRYLKEHPSIVGREPTKPLAWGGYLPIWESGRVADAAATLYHDIGMRGIGFMLPEDAASKARMEVVRRRLQDWKVPQGRSIALGAYRNPPTIENIARAKEVALQADILPLLQRFDYGDEIEFSEWLGPLSPAELTARFAAWQQRHKGKIEFETPDSSAGAAASTPTLYVDSRRFYEDTAISYVAQQARAIPKALGEEVLYGANLSAHPFYYPEISAYIKWFRATPEGDYAANFGRHSEYFWQIGQPGPLVNGYVADHFRAGMRDNPQATNIQYSMPHALGNTDRSFLRTAFTHLAHGARGLDYFGIGLNSSWTENYVDFRYPGRFAAIRDVNRAMALVEDILPQSRVVPSRIALILSDSTERWDWAGSATDRAGADVFGHGYKKTRLAYHQERVGLYYALVHNSRPPDLLIEEDVQKGQLRNYDVAYWVGDCIEPATLKALSQWVQEGGHVTATAGAFRYDQYKRALPEGLKLLGLKSAELQEKQWFFRPQIELPRLRPLDQLKVGANTMPALALLDEVTVADDTKVVASFESGKPAVTERALGKGRITFVATLPGVAYLWSAYQAKPGGRELVPSRGPSSHMELTDFDAAAKECIMGAALPVHIAVDAHGARIDARLLRSPAGYAVPIANYETDVEAPVTLTLRGIPGGQRVISARRGALKVEKAVDGSLSVNYSPGVGDILRIEP